MTLRWGNVPEDRRQEEEGGKSTNLATYGQGVSQENSLETDMSRRGGGGRSGGLESRTIWRQGS